MKKISVVLFTVLLLLVQSRARKVKNLVESEDEVIQENLEIEENNEDEEYDENNESEEEGHDFEHQSRITGGHFVFGSSGGNPYPYLVSVQAYNPLTYPNLIGGPAKPAYNYSHVCGGTVLNKNHILTAGLFKLNPF